MNHHSPISGTLIDALKALYPDSSTSTLRIWLKNDRVSVDNIPTRMARTPVQKGQNLTVSKRQQVIRGKIEILYEDSDLVVIHKPRGILSVATERVTEFTAHSFLKKHYYPKRVFVVHRLDRETSGLMIFARSEEAQAKLKDELSFHRIQRDYVAVVEGVLDDKRGRWECHLVDGKDCVVRPTAPGEGKKAVTHYEVLSETATHSLLAFTLETGRKNQIRVHCQQAGHPIVGDLKYGASSSPIGRMALHARRLHFSHPTSGKAMDFEVEVPESFFRLGLSLPKV